MNGGRNELTRRAILSVGTAGAFAGLLSPAAEAAVFGVTAKPKPKATTVKRLIVLVPHPDDEVLSMWPAMHYLASGYEVHFVYFTRGDVTAASLKLDGSGPCAWHGYTHNPAMEGYAVPSQEQIGMSRLHEGMSCVGGMWRIPPTIAGDSGQVFTHDKNLGSQFGSGFASSSTAPVIPAAVTQCEDIIRDLDAELPGSLFWSMSPTDAHCDHAAIGKALRNLKGTPHLSTSDPDYLPGDPVLAPRLLNASFFASKLYWGTSTVPRQAALAAEPCHWYPQTAANPTATLARRAEYTGFLRSTVVPMYTAWQPAQGAFAIGGGHSTPSQFANCFGPQLSVVSALWHP